jgi:hypothetical protein
VPEDDPKAAAEYALTTFLRLKGTGGEPTLQEIAAMVHTVANRIVDPHRTETWVAICRIGESLEMTGVAASPLWNDAISQTKKWREQLD